MENLTNKYAECVRKIVTWNLFRKIPKSSATDRCDMNLNSMLELSSQFGNPHLAFDAVHIAGTNGKGSAAIKTARAL